VSDSSIPPDPEDEPTPVPVLSDEDLAAFLGSIEPEPEKQEPFPEQDQQITDEGDPFKEATVPVGDGSCLVCGAPTFRPPGLTKAGHKKRTPKYCDLHDPKLRISQDGPQFTGVESQLQRIQEELADDIRLLGTLAGPLFPVTGYYVFLRADPFTIALIKLCKNNQRALRVLHRAASIAPVYEVAKDVAGVAYAVQVDTNRADPHNTVSQRLGVAQAYDSVFPTQQTNGSTASTGFPGPPRYANA
jgi:hypothetical protein